MTTILLLNEKPCVVADAVPKVQPVTRTIDAITPGQFFATAMAELVSCHAPMPWLNGRHSAWLLTLHPAASARVYAVYGAVVIALGERAA